MISRLDGATVAAGFLGGKKPEYPTGAVAYIEQ